MQFSISFSAFTLQFLSYPLWLAYQRFSKVEYGPQQKATVNKEQLIKRGSFIEI